MQAGWPTSLVSATLVGVFAFASSLACRLDNGKRLKPGERVINDRSTFECQIATGGIRFIVKDAPPPGGLLGGYFMVQGLFTSPDVRPKVI